MGRHGEQAAVSAGAYGDNGTDSRIVGRPIPDLYRFFEHGRDGFSDPGLGLTPYFSGVSFSWENSINYYNAQDFALDLWDINNFSKDLYLQSFLWPYDYEFEAGDGENTNNDIFTRDPDVGPNVNLTLTLPNGRPGRDAYEILAFFGIAASLPLGTKVVSYFDTNVDLENFTMPGDSDIRLNHSFQFNHDAATTWDFYELLKMELGFDSSHGSGAIAGTSLAASDWSSRKPASSGVADAFVPFEDKLAEIYSIVTTSLSPASHTSLGGSRRLNSLIRDMNRLDTTPESADLALLDWAAKQAESDAVLPANEFVGDNGENGEEFLAIDGYFEMLDDPIDFHLS